MATANRVRNERYHICMTTEEKELIKEKMKLVGIDNIGEFFRRMAIEGLVYDVTMPDIKKTNYELQKIGTNINQIAKSMNRAGNIYEQDVLELRELVDKIWQLQRYILSNIR